MKIIYFIGVLLIVVCSGCKPAEITINPSLEVEAMPVKGRNGLLIGQVISYGEYSTDKVRRGWTKSYDLPFFIRFQGAKEKLSFTQYGKKGTEADVTCISRFKSSEIPLLKDYFSIPLKLENSFAGTVSLDAGYSTWDFILHNPNGDFLRGKASAGFIQFGLDRIDIQAVHGLNGQPGWMKAGNVYGHEFVADGKIVGAVSMVNKGTVWIDPQLDNDTQTVIAAVATALLLRTDVEEANENLN